jgi:hypothetical protein
MPLAVLRAFWRERWGLPPKLRSVELLRHLVAWKLQAEAWGGLDADVKAKLRSKGVPRVAPVSAGTRLVREYKGVLHEVECGERGVTYQGRRFSSLSAVATDIAGTHWNGPRFFGLCERTGR